MNIRLVEPRDVPAIVELVATTLVELGIGHDASSDAELRALPAAYSDGAFWVATDGDLVIGTCGVQPVASDTFELRKLYLRPTARGQGVGKRLLEVAIAWSRARGARRIVLDTFEVMTRAIAFYEAYGFRRDDEQIREPNCNRGYALDL